MKKLLVVLAFIVLIFFCFIVIIWNLAPRHSYGVQVPNDDWISINIPQETQPRATFNYHPSQEFINDSSEQATEIVDLTSEKAIYTAYLLAGGCDDVLRIVSEELDSVYSYEPSVKSLLIDINEDGVQECFLRVPDPYYGEYVFLLTIIDGSVNELISLYPGGNSMWGSIALRRDLQNERIVVEYIDYWRDGIYAGGETTKIYTFSENDLSENMEVSAEHYAKPEYVSSYIEIIEQIQAETTLYYEDESDIWFYKSGGKYISEEEYSTILEQFVALGEEYTIVKGTLERPIP